MAANPLFHRLYAEHMKEDFSDIPLDARIGIFMVMVKTFVPDIIKMCSEAIDDLIKSPPVDAKTSKSILHRGIGQLRTMTRDSEQYGTGILIPGSKTPIATYMTGGICALLVKCIANLDVLQSKGYINDMFLDYLLTLFLYIKTDPDGHKQLTTEGLPEALSTLSDKLKSTYAIGAIIKGIQPSKGGRRRSKKHGRSKKTKTRRSRK